MNDVNRMKNLPSFSCLLCPLKRISGVIFPRFCRTNFQRFPLSRYSIGRQLVLGSHLRSLCTRGCCKPELQGGYFPNDLPGSDQAMQAEKWLSSSGSGVSALNDSHSRSIRNPCFSQNSSASLEANVSGISSSGSNKQDKRPNRRKVICRIPDEIFVLIKGAISRPNNYSTTIEDRFQNLMKRSGKRLHFDPR